MSFIEHRILQAGSINVSLVYVPNAVCTWTLSFTRYGPALRYWELRVTVALGSVHTADSDMELAADSAWKCQTKIQGNNSGNLLCNPLGFFFSPIYVEKKKWHVSSLDAISPIEIGLICVKTTGKSTTTFHKPHLCTERRTVFHMSYEHTLTLLNARVLWKCFAALIEHGRFRSSNGTTDT